MIVKFASSDSPGARLLSAGFAHLRAASFLAKDDAEQVAWPVTFTNIAFAIELGLKGYLHSQGVNRPALKNIGHDLSKAFTMAVARGFKSSHPAIQKLVDEVSPRHKNMSLRYIEGDTVQLMKITTALGLSECLLYDLTKQSGLLERALP